MLPSESVFNRKGAILSFESLKNPVTINRNMSGLQDPANITGWTTSLPGLCTYRQFSLGFEGKLSYWDNGVSEFGDNNVMLFFRNSAINEWFWFFLVAAWHSSPCPRKTGGFLEGFNELQGDCFGWSNRESVSWATLLPEPSCLFYKPGRCTDLYRWAAQCVAVCFQAVAVFL